MSKEKVSLNQEAILICPICEERRMVVWCGMSTQPTKLFCLECGRFWMEVENIKAGDKDPMAYTDWKIRELDKKVQEMVEDVKSKLINNCPETVLHFQDEEVDDYTKYLDQKNKEIDKEVEWIVEGAISKVIEASLTSMIPCLDIPGAINYIERGLETLKREEGEGDKK